MLELFAGIEGDETGFRDSNGIPVLDDAWGDSSGMWENVGKRTSVTLEL